jgi:hypothetical protein
VVVVVAVDEDHAFEAVVLAVVEEEDPSVVVVVGQQPFVAVEVEVDWVAIVVVVVVEAIEHWEDKHCNIEDLEYKKNFHKFFTSVESTDYKNMLDLRFYSLCLVM